MVSENPEQEGPAPDDARIVIYFAGDSPVPKYVDFHKITPFHMMAIASWLEVKGKQMVALAEQAEAGGNVQVAELDPETVKRVLRVGRG